MKTNKIIIVGGGSAGWMAAATLISQFPNKDITVIESPNVPTVGVGESTLGQINGWLDLLGIKDEDFMPHTDASYKLSIRFEDFYQKGDGGFHYPFGSVIENKKLGLKQLWFLKKYLKPETPITEYTNWLYQNMALVNNNVLFKNENKELEYFNFQFDTAYHFDATKFGLWLKDQYCIPKGVKHILEDVKTIETNENGIVSLNNTYKADMFIDCTGFKSLLLGDTLKEHFNDYSHLLPNNKAWATRVPYKDKENELVSYTNCTAIENGWVWNIPSWERIGTGYVYSDKYVSDEEALNEFKRHLDKKGSDYSNSEFKNIKMRVGIHDRLFVKNVCAIGLSAGFIEPLESNGLLSVHEFLINLVKVMKRGDEDTISQWDRDNFNVECKRFFDEFTEFVSMHYALSHRDDTKYWKDISNKSFYDNRLTDSTIKADILGKMKSDEWLRSDSGHHCIGVGLRYFGYDILKDNSSEDAKIKIGLREKEVNKWNTICKDKPKLLQFLKDNIHKDA
jgi:flavin-dependent dehydrogenase